MSKRGWPHVDNPVAVGERLKDARLRAGLSQRELAFPGCTAVYICRIERGDRVPSLQVLRELARRVGVSESYLATGTEATAADPLAEAEVALRLDQLELAEHLFTQVLESSTEQVPRARALGGLGQVDFHAGRVPAAIDRLEDARELLGERLTDYPAIPETLGRAYAAQNEFAMAIAVFERALELAKAASDAATAARFEVLLANALIDSGDLASARTHLGHALADGLDARDPIQQARLYWSQSRLHSAEKNLDAAARYARMALASIELTDHAVYAARAHHLLAFVELERGNAEGALELLDRGYPLVARAGDAETEARFRLERARALAKIGRGDEAASLALEVAGSMAESGITKSAGRAYAVAAEIRADRGDRARALELYELATELAADGPNYLVEIWSRMAELLEAEGRTDEALEVLKRAVGARTAVPDAR